MPTIQPGHYSAAAFGTYVRIVQFNGRDYTVALDTEGVCENMVHVLDPSKATTAPNSDVVMSGAYFNPETGKVSLTWPDGTMAEEISEDWDDEMIPVVEDVARHIYQSKIDREIAAKHNNERLSAIACAVEATAAFDKIAAGDDSGRQDLADFLLRQLPISKSEFQLSEGIRNGLAQWVVAKDRHDVFAAIDTIVLALADRTGKLFFESGMSDPAGSFHRVAATPERRNALIQLIGMSEAEAKSIMQNPHEFVDKLCAVFGAGVSMASGIRLAIDQMTGGIAAPAPKGFARPAIAIGPAPPPTPSLDGPYRDAICRSIDAGDPNEVAAFTAILIAMELPTLRADCLRASCEPDAQKRAELVEAIRERLYHASGEKDAMVDVEDVMSGKVAVVTPHD